MREPKLTAAKVLNIQLFDKVGKRCVAVPLELMILFYTTPWRISPVQPRMGRRHTCGIYPATETPQVKAKEAQWMPQSDFTEAMLAPCGMNCAVCYKHLGKKPCRGCNTEDAFKPEHCRTCNIKQCAHAKGIRFCWECGDFPCKPVKLLDRRYRLRYGVSLIENSRMIQAQGPHTFQQKQQEQYACPACGGTISLHDRVCSSCKAEYPIGGREAPK